MTLGLYTPGFAWLHAFLLVQRSGTGFSTTQTRPPSGLDPPSFAILWLSKWACQALFLNAGGEFRRGTHEARGMYLESTRSYFGKMGTVVPVFSF